MASRRIMAFVEPLPCVAVDDGDDSDSDRAAGWDGIADLGVEGCSSDRTGTAIKSSESVSQWISESDTAGAESVSPGDSRRSDLPIGWLTRNTPRVTSGGLWSGCPSSTYRR